MHWEQVQFIRSVKAVFPAYFSGGTVLEIGSYDVNGSVRPLFDAARYVGVDLIAGPGVDVVCSGHEFRSEERFDVAISTECFEHNPFYAATFLNMARHVREGGMVLFTCAGEGRPEHGTLRCDPASSPGTVALQSDYYCNLTEEDFTGLDLAALFAEFRFFRNDSSHDLYFVGLTHERGRLDRLAELCATVERLCQATTIAFDLFRSGEVEDALRRMQLVSDEAPLSARDHILAQQGWLLAMAKRFDAAEAVVREALALSDTADLYWQLGTILHSSGRSAEALEPAQHAVERAPANAKFIYFLGAMLGGQNRLEEAEQWLQRAIGLDPALAAAHLQLSMICLKQGRSEAATAAARRAAELAPDAVEVRRHLEHLLRRDRVVPSSDDRPRP
jgi:Flp pilus assembly protein TadD